MKSEFPLPEGVVRIEFPGVMSEESFIELEDWFKLLMRSVGRNSEMETGPRSTASEIVDSERERRTEILLHEQVEVASDAYKQANMPVWKYIGPEALCNGVFIKASKVLSIDTTGLARLESGFRLTLSDNQKGSIEVGDYYVLYGSGADAFYNATLFESNYRLDTEMGSD